jgi:hypothetical protein
MTLHKISPLLLSLTIDAPLPLILKTFPVWVLEGIFSEILFSNVGIWIDPPITEISKGIGASIYKCLPSLSKRGLSLTLMAT